MPIVADAAVAVRGDLTKFNQDLARGGEQGARTFGERFKAAFNPKNLIGPGIAVIGGAVVAGLAGATKALIDIERLNAQTDAVIRSTGGAAGVTRAQIEEAAEAAERATTIEREAVQEAQNLLLTFTNIRDQAGTGNDIFSQATDSVLDMSVAMGTDARSAAMQLGKALNDPVRGMMQLGRAGVQFTEEQKALVEQLVATGDVLGAQKVILAELETQFGGSAEAFADTTAGKIQRFQNDVGNMFESIVLGALKVGDALEQNVVGPTGEAFNDIALNFGDMGTRVHDVADRLGTDFQTVKDEVREHMAATGDTFDETMLFIEQRADGGMAQVHNAVSTNMGGVPSTIESYADEIRVASETVAEIPANAIRAEWAETQEAAYQMLVEYHKGLLRGQNLPQIAFDAAMQLVEEEMTRTEEVAQLKGQLTTLAHARGIASAEGKTASVQAIDSAMAIIEGRLDALGVNAYVSGTNVGYSLAAGMNATLGVVKDAAGNVAAAATGQLQIRSEPPDHDSPLRGITKWGGNIAKTIADGMLENTGYAASAASVLAGALAPSVGYGSPEMAGAGAGGPTFILQVEGQSRTLNSMSDLWGAFDSMGSFSDRSMTR